MVLATNYGFLIKEVASLTSIPSNQEGPHQVRLYTQVWHKQVWCYALGFIPKGSEFKMCIYHFEMGLPFSEEYE